jgi:toxin ParE1/3/4
MRLEFSPRAFQDLEAIGDYIARDNPKRAASFIRDLREHCRKMAMTPTAYRQRPELAPGLRSCVFGSYVIFFDNAAASVRIVRILHGAMDVETRLSPDDDKTAGD